MKRKVAQVGPTTLMVSLPKKWTRKKGIQKGDEIDVLEEGDKLLIGTAVKLQPKEITLAIPKAEDYLGRFIVAAYVKGHNVITVRFSDTAVYDKVLETSKLLMGFEVVENTDEHCKLVNISTTLEQKFDILLRRLFVSVAAFGKELFSRLQAGTDIQGLLEYETNINRIHLFCRRAIQTRTIGDTAYSSETLYRIVTSLEEIADCFRYIVETIGQRKAALDRTTKELFSQCLRLQDITFTLFNKISSGASASSEMELFKEHKAIRKKILHQEDCFAGDAINSFICGRLFAVADLSFNVTEELF
ncbi:hypothetical protein HYU19_00435 [Candidatus Woesearchaeota archaeon]|nr:hypothetical protein [Candidatus Woesearchaeota archaeon]